MDLIQRVETFPLLIPREVPYLGSLNGIVPNKKGCFIRPGNKTIYSIHTHSMLVKVTTTDGVTGWGEALTPVAPKVAACVVDELLGPLLIGKDPQNVVAIHEDLYDIMRVRGYSEGFFSDGLSALDMALWDIKGKQLGLPVGKLLGGQRRLKIPAYISGLPRTTLPERVELAQEWIQKDFNAVKFATVVSYEGDVEEIAALRKALGPQVSIMADLHWRFDSVEAVRVIRRMNEYGLAMAEAPVHPQDIQGQAFVTEHCGTNVGVGEEIRNEFDFRDRFVHHCMNIAQPEMGRLGITAFWNVCQMARAFHTKIMPHASIGVGVFLAASLQVSSAVQDLPCHEYQHSVMDGTLRFLDTDMACEKGLYTVPSGSGLGVEPRKELFEYVMA